MALATLSVKVDERDGPDPEERHVRIRAVVGATNSRLHALGTGARDASDRGLVDRDVLAGACST